MDEKHDKQLNTFSLFFHCYHHRLRCRRFPPPPTPIDPRLPSPPPPPLRARCAKQCQMEAREAESVCHMPCTPPPPGWIIISTDSNQPSATVLASPSPLWPSFCYMYYCYVYLPLSLPTYLCIPFSFPLAFSPSLPLLSIFFSLRLLCIERLTSP